MRHAAQDLETRPASSWWDHVTARASEREATSRIATHESHRSWDAVMQRLRARLPELVPDYLNMLVGALLGLWLLAWLSARYLGASPSYLLAACGMLYAMQAAWYGARLNADPTFKVPKCGCAGGAKDNPDAVLRSVHSRIGGVPNAVLAVGFYVGFTVLVLLDLRAIATVGAGLSVLVSAWLGYVMVTRVRALCANCISLAAVNILLLAVMLG